MKVARPNVGIPDAGHLVDALLFLCDSCSRLVPWSLGADDDMPGACDDCWSKAHAEPATGSGGSA